jgi:hypothetical protein
MPYPARHSTGAGPFILTFVIGALLGAAGLYGYLHHAEIAQMMAAPQATEAPRAAAPAAPPPVTQPVQAPVPKPGAPQPEEPQVAAAPKAVDGAPAAAPPLREAAPAVRSKAAPAAPALPRAAAPAPAPGVAAPVAPAAKPIVPPAAAAPRSFAMGRTEAENVRGVSQSLEGFRKKKEVQVKRMPEVDGVIQFEVTPASVRPGDRYTLKTYLIHSGKKAISIDEMTVSTSVDGSRSASRVSPLAKRVPPGMHVLLDQRSGVVKPGTRSWAMEVAVTSDHRDVYRNRVTLR